MNPNSGEGNVKFESQPIGGEEQDAARTTENNQALNPENKAQQQPLQLNSQAATDLAQPAQSIILPSDDSSKTQQSQQSSDASDTERIEPIWINRTKEVVAKTLDDPYEQKKEMSKVKAEYIQKRFNKTIKTEESG